MTKDQEMEFNLGYEIAAKGYEREKAEELGPFAEKGYDTWYKDAYE